MTPFMRRLGLIRSRSSGRGDVGKPFSIHSRKLASPERWQVRADEGNPPDYEAEPARDGLLHPFRPITIRHRRLPIEYAIPAILIDARPGGFLGFG